MPRVYCRDRLQSNSIGTELSFAEKQNICCNMIRENDGHDNRSGACFTAGKAQEGAWT